MAGKPLGTLHLTDAQLDALIDAIMAKCGNNFRVSKSYGRRRGGSRDSILLLPRMRVIQRYDARQFDWLEVFWGMRRDQMRW